jgi:molecular chaperone HtpG
VSSSNFQVDLRGIVDLLSHHLYGSPRVYVRELLQNAVDAVTARRELDPEAPGHVRLVVGDGRLEVHDSGIGLDEDEVHQFLSTIGRSSKRDELDFARSDFLGQFGIGLLSAFLVADEVRVITRSARRPDAVPVAWVGRADGSYEVGPAGDGDRPAPGTTVLLVARRGCEDWLAPDRVVDLARDYGSMLPYDVVVERPGGTVGVTDGPAVWEVAHASPRARADALAAHCEATFGFPPLASFDLDVPGVRGVAYVVPTPTSPARRPRHRVYLKRMLLGDTVDGLLPEWAFFVRCVVDATEVRPTASREALYADDLLTDTQEALGEQIRRWITDLAVTDADTLRRFLVVHHLGVKALAQHDDHLLATVLPFLEFETTIGRVTLDAFRRVHPEVRYTDTVEEFRRVSAVAAAQGLGVVNGGYVYDAELLERLPTVAPGTVVARLEPGALTARLDGVPPAAEHALAPFLDRARKVLGRLRCDVVLRAFDPISLPGLYLDDREAAHERRRADVAEAADDLWGGILTSLERDTPRAQLVLNHRNALVRRVGALDDDDLVALAVESLYVQSLLMAHQPLQPADVAALNRSFTGLLDWATHVGQASSAGGGGTP